MKSLGRWLVIASLVILGAHSSFAANVIESTFDGSDEGWTATPGAAIVTFQPTAGHPGGYLSSTDTDPTTPVVIAPAKFRGDLRAFDGGYLAYDMVVIDPLTPITQVGDGLGRVQINGVGVNATFSYLPSPPLPVPGEWTRYVVPLNAAAFNTTPENWQSVLSNVTQLTVIIQHGTKVGLDNFQLVPAPDLTNLIVFSKPGFSYEVLRKNLGVPLTSLWLSPGTVADGEGSLYDDAIHSPTPGEARIALVKIPLDGPAELFAYYASPDRYNTAGVYAKHFDDNGDLIGVLDLYSSDWQVVSHSLIRITGFGPAAPVQVAAPTITPNGGAFTSSVAVTLATTTAGAEIRYTLDGGTPTALSPLYTGPVSVTASATLKARAFKPGMTDSAVASAVFTVQAPSPVAAPAISPNGGSFTGSVLVSLSTTTSGATIRYTTDGTTPNASSPVYSSPFTLTGSATVKAYAVKSGMTDSGVASAGFTVTPPGGEFAIPGANTSSRSSGSWNVSGTEIYAWAANTWLEYSVDFGAGGTRTFRVSAMNNTNPNAPGLPGGYSFNLAVQVDGVGKGNLQVPGSTTAFQTGSLFVVSIPAGVHTVRFTWTNDAWLSGTYDANIRIKEVSFAP